MKILVVNKWRLVTSIFFITASLSVGFLSFSTAAARPPVGTSPGKQPASVSPATPGPSFPTYVPGNFSFTAPLELTGHPQPPLQAFYQEDSEPEIKTDIFGTVYVTAIQGVPGGVDLWKSNDKGASFVYLGQPDGAQDHCGTGQLPQCFGIGGGDDSIDVSKGGYLYVSSLWLGNVTASTTWDGGIGGIEPDQLWKVDQAAAGLPSDDRQWVASYGPQTVYMTYNVLTATDPPGIQFGLFFVKSTDGGKTWSAPAAVTPLGQTNSVNDEGNLVVDQYSGYMYTAYLPLGAENQISIARSTDGGATWTTITAYNGPAGTSNRGVFPMLALDRGGNLHLAFANYNASNHTNCHVYLTSSANPAAASPTWTTPIQVDSGPGNVSAGEPWIVAGSPGIVDVTWLGSTMTSPYNTPSGPGEYWHVFFAQVTNALSGSPTISQNQVDSTGVHNHSLCFDGGGCASAGSPHQEPGNRDLAEYYTMTLDPDGFAYIAYADSLTNCNQQPTAPFCASNTWFTKQTTGSSAYSPPAGPPPATFAANLALPGSGGDAEPNMRADTYNCLFSAAPGNPDAWKSADAGFSFFNLPNPVTSAGGIAGGGDEEIVTVPQPNGARPDQIYFADLAVASVNISKSTDGGASWFSPGPGGAAGEVSVSTDRQWMSWDRSGADTTVYLWEHEFVSQILRMNALTDDMVWSPFASGMTDPELLATQSTAENTVPGPTFVDPATHRVYGFLSASTPTTNAIGAPAGKLPNVWEADGAGTFTAGVPPGPFANHPVFKGLIDSPSTLPSPAPSPNPAAKTVGANTANLFNGATIDRAGNIYATWATPSGRTGLYDVWFASSRDHGQTYYGPFKINPNGIQGNMPWVTAGDNGRVEIVYYGTTGTQDPTTSTTDQWKVYFAQSLNAADREPVFTNVQASDHITHQGPICNVGILCSSGTRQLLDFFQVAIGPDGLANIAYADTGTGNGSPHVSYARQNGGPLGLTNPTNVTCLAPPPAPTGVVSRKTHGSAGTFDVNLLSTCGIEDRTGGSNGDFQVVITFPVAVTVQGATVSSSDNQATADAPTGSGGTSITVNIHHVSNAQQLTVTLIDVSSGAGDLGNVPVAMKVLAGDTNCDGVVNSADIGQTKAQSGQVTIGSNFREDVNEDGVINSADIGLVKSKSGTFLP